MREVFLAVFSVTNIVLDIWFVMGLRMGVSGAKKEDRIRRGTHIAVASSAVFCVIISVLIWIFADVAGLVFYRRRGTSVLQ